MAVPGETIGRQIREWAAELFLGRTEQDTKNRRQSQQHDRTTFETRLRDLLKEQGKTLTGRMYIVNLREIKLYYGNKWLQVQDLVYRGIGNIIDQHLTIRDFYTRGGDQYIIVFPDLTEEEAAGKCSEISDHIAKHFIRVDCNAPRFDTRTSIATVDEDHLAAAGSPLAAISAQTKAAKQDPGQIDPPATDRSPLVKQRVSFKYRAMWHTGSKTVASFICHPYSGGPRGAALNSNHATGKHQDTRRNARLDLEILSRVVDDLKRASLGASNAFLVFPVHFRTLMDAASRKRFLDIAGSLTPDHRKRLVAEITELPVSFTDMNAKVIENLFGRLPKAYLARLPIDCPDFSRYADAGFSAVGADLSEYDWSESRLLPALEAFAERADAVGLSTYVHGLNSLSLTTAAVCAGFDHIDGDTISDVSASPHQTYPLDAKQLYLRNTNTPSVAEPA